ncbi:MULTISPECIES: hypothetical protein [Nitrosomonas]|uniref:hypothetical protein n=1 Tax=Nitrosomonas TaxID=914 RepID=UPI0002EABF75|nr:MULTISPECIES: hypothetical protein [Nitrosomonas]MEB2331906.1 hypothetical protein [Nitrosomonas sp.]SDW58594.1 hypothetical protein SAMN05216310_12319 [Nitrosomonas europaea]SET19525.1 hypothetical protein SAMN05216309_12419 [Nitrosomonas europaea]SJZ71256.1 hypothetical protein SAMN02745113_01691 [Nitrosomonas europaea]HBF24698.1 hypothetical protein [Nitrosomonas sp.]
MTAREIIRTTKGNENVTNCRREGAVEHELLPDCRCDNIIQGLPAIAILSDARILGIVGMQLSVRRFSKEQNHESDTTFA